MTGPLSETHTTETRATCGPCHRRLVRPLSPAARRALEGIGDDWQKVPYWIKASHVAVLIRQGHIEHRWPFDLVARMRLGTVPWLREGEIRRTPNT